MNDKTKKIKKESEKSVTKLLREGIKTQFTDYLATLGFKREKAKDSSSLSYSFRRILPNRHDLVAVQFDRHHWPQFVINFGSCPPEGIVDAYGRKIQSNDVRYYFLVQHGRLYRSCFFIFRRWFKVTKIDIKILGAEKAVQNEIDNLISKFPQVDTWFEDGNVGANIIVTENPFNEAEAIKHSMIENGIWPPEGWNEDEH